MRRWNLRTLILVIVVFALGFALFAQQRREARLRSALDLYRDRGHERILDLLDEPLALSYPSDQSLEDVMKQIKTRTKGNRLPSGIPIYVDPIGLSEAGVTMSSPAKPAASPQDRTLGEELTQILEPLGLAWKAGGGFLMITSKESLDATEGEDPYLEFRDVLK